MNSDEATLIDYETKFKTEEDTEQIETSPVNTIENSNISKCYRNVNHPFEKHTHIKTAQNAFELASKKDTNWTCDNCHLKPGCIEAAFTKEFFDMIVQNIDTIVSDSSSCTATGFGYANQDRYGLEFNQKLNDRSFSGRYLPEWGKGFKWFSWRLEEEEEEKWYQNEGKGGNVGRVAIICAGNDILDSRQECDEGLEEIAKWNPTIFNVVPMSTI